jgi:hypothetical protein
MRVLDKLERDFTRYGVCTYIEMDKPNAYVLKRMPRWCSDAELDMELVRLNYEV